MKVFEVQEHFYHGSSKYLDVGTILTPRNQDYEADWGDSDFYKILEFYRPQDKLGHSNSVFMTDNIDDVDLASGGSEWLFTVVPLGPVQRHDLNWSSEISALVQEGYNVDSSEIKSAAEKYWNGVPHPNESLWEYLTSRAKIVHVEEY